MSRYEHWIDLAKAAQAEHHAYMLKLMIPLNDLLSLVYLSTIDPKKARRKEVHNGGISYLIRMQCAHVYEAYIAFVKAIEPTNKAPDGQEPVYHFIQKHVPLRQAFAELQDEMKNPYFTKIGIFRNTFQFHYNHSYLSKATANAVRQMIDVDEEQAGRESNLILRSLAPEESRFVVGDELVQIAWYSAILSHDHNYWTIERLLDFKAFQQRAASKFIHYADLAILTWITENQLQARPKATSNSSDRT